VMSSLARNLDQTLEAAVVVAWDDLVKASKLGLVHIRYSFAADLSLADLEVWVSEIRGHWMLVCRYPGTSAVERGNLTFSNGYRSDLLAQFLDFVIGHQDAFARAPLLERDSLIQVQVPSEDEKARALKLMNEAQSLGDVPQPPALAKAS
jgi:hypothetical protein